MRSLFALGLLALACGIGFAKEAAPLADDPVVEQRMLSISEEMRCLVCQNESLAASRAGLATAAVLVLLVYMRVAAIAP